MLRFYFFKDGNYIMVSGILFYVLATLVGLAFWVFVGIIIYRLIKKQSLKAPLITLSVLAVVWILSIAGGTALIISSKKDVAIKAVPINYESAKRNWSTKILKKTSDFNISVDKIEKILSEKDWLRATDVDKEKDMTEVELSYEKQKDELLGVNNSTCYELTLVVENNSKNAAISYKELRKSNLVYVQDENDVFIPAYIINHAEFDDVPWLLTWLLPQYKKDQKVEFVPIGKSYLNVRVEIPAGHTISKFVFGNSTIDINMSDYIKE